ncbi:hypothetical protein BDN72DRAFT_846910 [Pluteus cervinus]|uniref:Uncharacterized protein n=1 Tax=Pluteus cervinus TaxID=181527 RepID=A0ACD3AFM6_9AGAR|nr:hypothetical protein BDN72DRAFT_846910 [Pluteus cervinus]
MKSTRHTRYIKRFLGAIAVFGLWGPSICNAQTTLFIPLPTTPAPSAANPTLSADILGIDNSLDRTTWELRGDGGTALLVEGSNYASIGNTAFQAQCTFGAGQPAAVCSGYLVAPTPTQEGPGTGPHPGSVIEQNPNQPDLETPPVQAVTWTEPVSYATVLAGTTADGIIIIATVPNPSGSHVPTTSTQGPSPTASTPASASSGGNSNPGPTSAAQTTGLVNGASHIGVGLLAALVVGFMLSLP